MTAPDKVKYLASAGMLIAAVFIFMRSSLGSGDIPGPTLSLERVPQERLEVDSMLATLTKIKTRPSVAAPNDWRTNAIFVLNARTCAPCLFEVHEYLSVIAELDPQGMRSAVVVVDSTFGRARRFADAAQFDVPTYYAKELQLPSQLRDGPLANKLWLNAFEGDRPLVVVALPGGSTSSVESKLHFLARHADAFGSTAKAQAKIDSILKDNQTANVQ